MEINDLQTLWQGQAAPETLAVDTLAEVQSFQRKAKRQKLFIYILLPLTSIFILSMILLENNPFYVAGILINVVAMGFAVWKFKQTGPIDNPKEAASLTPEFIQRQLDRLSALESLSKRTIPLYLFLIMGGQVLASVAFIQERSTSFQVLFLLSYGLGLSLFAGVTYYFGRRKWIRKWEPYRQLLDKRMDEIEASPPH